MRQRVMPRHYLNALALPSLLVIGLAGGAQSLQAPASKEAQGPFQISVNVDLVVLNATVRDSKGRFAPDLGERDFAVYEDGVRQSISLFRHEDIPVTVGLVVDHSSSMMPKIRDVIADRKSTRLNSSHLGISYAV